MYFAVAIGGAVGACLRMYIQEWVLNLLGKSFPFGTLAVNVMGSFAIGLALAYFQQNEAHSSELKAFITIGILGSLTTFSTFSLDTFLLLQKGDFVSALVNIVLNVILCVGAVWLALIITKG